MPAETTFAKIRYALAADETKAFPAEVSEPGAKTIDAYLEEHTFSLKKRAASYEAKSGEWGLQESSAKTVTLPAATANRIVAVTSTVAEAKITTSGGAFIYGKWLTVASKTATVVLTEDMTAFFFADGTNWILWGEIKSEEKVAAAVLRTVGTPFKPSESRPVWLVAKEPNDASVTALKVGGVEIPGVLVNGTNVGIGVYVNPGEEVDTNGTAGKTYKTQHRLL